MGRQRLEQKNHQSLSPQQIQFLGLLQTPIVSLEKKIEEELEENPALEEEEEEYGGGQYYSYKKSIFEDFQIEDKTNRLEDYLSKQLVGVNLDEHVLFLVEYLINSLDDNGFLSRDLYAISSDILANNNKEVSEKDLQLALVFLQGLDPIGVGAKNIQDCLLIQLKKLYPLEKTAFEIVSKNYDAFSNKNFEHLVKTLPVSKEKLKNIYHLIEKLNPIPAAGFSKNTDSTEYVYPDFKLMVNNNDVQLYLNKSNIKPIKISKYYSDLLLETSDLKTKDFLRKKIERARWFKDSIKQREKTLREVMVAIIKIQKKYLISGAESDLKPMKLADVASVVKMDISTISRVSNSKYVEAHFGTFKLKELFSDAYRKDNGEVISTKEIKKHLKKIINSEDKKAPYTDEKLSDLLGKDEYHIARRTVAKYRESLGIETSRLRREL